MKITYNTLKSLIKNFGRNDEDVQTFIDPESDGEAQIIYQQCLDWGTVPYLKYVFYSRKDISSIVEPLLIDFSEVDFNNLDEDFMRILNIIEHSCYLCGIAPYEKITRFGTDNDDVIHNINNIYNTCLSLTEFPYGFAVDLSSLSEITTDNIYQEIIGQIEDICEKLKNDNKVKADSQPLQLEDFRYIYITQEIPVDVALDLQKKLKIALNCELKYHSAELFDAIQEQQRRQNLEESKAIAEKCYGLYFDDKLLKDYNNFADDYNKYEEVYNVICDWLKQQGTQGRYRYIVGEETCSIPCIEIMLAWVTVTTGTVFIFKAELETRYNEVISLIVNGSILPADLKFRMLTKIPTIKDRILLGVSTLRYENRDINSLVALKSVNQPVKDIRGIPLGILLSEIQCTNEEGTIVDVKNPSYKGFFMGKPKFSRADTIVATTSLIPAGPPLSTIDVVIDSFEERRQDIFNNLGASTEALRTLYSTAGYKKLFPQYLYAFEVIFTHYMGYDKFYTLNDIYIFPVTTDTGTELYACTLRYDSEYRVHVINFCDGKPIVDREELMVNNIYSPMFIADFQNAVTENGYTYPEINHDIQAAFEEALKVVKPEPANNNIMKLETTSTDIATADIYDYLYPVVSTSINTEPSDIIEADDSLQDDLKIYFKELIYSDRKRAINSNIKTRFMQTETTALSVISDNSANKKFLKEFIVYGLCDRIALKNRTQDLPILFNQQYLSYKGLRYLHPVESLIDWKGAIRTISRLSPAMCKKRR